MLPKLAKRLEAKQIAAKTGSGTDKAHRIRQLAGRASLATGVTKNEKTQGQTGTSNPVNQPAKRPLPLVMHRIQGKHKDRKAHRIRAASQQSVPCHWGCTEYKENAHTQRGTPNLGSRTAECPLPLGSSRQSVPEPNSLR